MLTGGNKNIFCYRRRRTAEDAIDLEAEAQRTKERLRALINNKFALLHQFKEHVQVSHSTIVCLLQNLCFLKLNLQ